MALIVKDTLIRKRDGVLPTGSSGFFVSVPSVFLFGLLDGDKVIGEIKIKEGELLSIDEVVRLELAKRWKIAIYGSEKEEIPIYDTMAERDLERITSMDGGKVRYRVKSFDEAEKTLSVVREIKWE